MALLPLLRVQQEWQQVDGLGPAQHPQHFHKTAASTPTRTGVCMHAFWQMYRTNAAAHCCFGPGCYEPDTFHLLQPSMTLVTLAASLTGFCMLLLPLGALATNR
jgi:hypothetical protein